MHKNNHSTAYSESLPGEVGKGPVLCLDQSKKHKNHASLAKPEVTEVAFLGLPLQSVKMSSMKASKCSQPSSLTPGEI